MAHLVDDGIVAASARLGDLDNYGAYEVQPGEAVNYAIADYDQVLTDYEVDLEDYHAIDLNQSTSSDTSQRGSFNSDRATIMTEPQNDIAISKPAGKRKAGSESPGAAICSNNSKVSKPSDVKKMINISEPIEETAMNIRQLAQKGVLDNAYDCIGFLREHRLLAKEMDCPKCASPMREEKTVASKQDGYRWRCQRSCCQTTTTIRKGSFFEKSSIGLTDLLLVIYFWAMDVPQRQIAYESDVSERTIIFWANFLREVCSSDLINNEKQLGGPGHIVAIGETQWCTNAQGCSVKPQWLFGGIDLSTKEVFVELIPEQGRTAPIMEELITRHIARGSTIFSDKIASYNHIEALGRNYIHQTVNHSREYITKDGIHTNHIKGLWSEIKGKFKRMKGVARDYIPSYLDEWHWRRQYPKKRQFLEILKAIARNPKYDVNREVGQ